MSTEEFISELFYRVDEAMTVLPKPPLTPRASHEHGASCNAG